MVAWMDRGTPAKTMILCGASCGYYVLKCRVVLAQQLHTLPYLADGNGCLQRIGGEKVYLEDK